MKPSGSHEIELGSDERLDLFMNGNLKLIQSKGGYRFSIDAILLSEFVTIKPGDVVVDLGTGCGIIPLVLLLKKPLRQAVGVEIQRELASQAARNALLNGFGDKMRVIRGDIRHPPIATGSADVVLCNPPYRKANSGRINPDLRRAIARHELLSSISDILETASKILRSRGRFAIIYPAGRLVGIVVRMRRFNLEPKRIRITYPNLTSGAKLALIEASLGAKPGVEIEAPILGQNFSHGESP
jgi:tRNA1Val (adenine37-N6)-methyltransferase